MAVHINISYHRAHARAYRAYHKDFVEAQVWRVVCFGVSCVCIIKHTTLKHLKVIMIHEVLLTNACLPTECFCVNVYSSWVRSFREARLGSPSTSTGWNREIQRTRRTWKQVSICTSICIFDPTDCLDLEESESNYNASWSDHFCSQNFFFSSSPK